MFVSPCLIPCLLFLQDGSTALHIAAALGNLPVCRMLLGLDPHQSNEDKDDDDQDHNDNTLCALSIL